MVRSMPSQSDEELQKTLPVKPGMVISGKYRVERLLAAGGMGAVLQAHHLVLDQAVAIKLMRPEMAHHGEAAHRFLREARAAAKIESDFVARVTDVDLLEDQTPFMVMEYLEGHDLDRVVDSDEVLTVSDAVDYVMQALAGLAAAHALGVVHRDLKPSNLFLVKRADGTTRVKVLDFGISKVIDEAEGGLKAGAMTSSQAILGTPRYMSPEQVSSSREVDGRTDIWAIGLILYGLLTKHYPFEGDNAGAVLAAILTEDVPPLREHRRDVPRELAEVVEKCLSKPRHERYPDVRSLMRALAPFASRRVQALLLDRDELPGAMGDTSTYGTPSKALSTARDAALASSASTTAVASTRPSDPGATRLTCEPMRSVSGRGAGPLGGSTETAMSAETPPLKSGGTRVVVALAAAVAVIAAGAWWLTRDEPPPPTAEAPAPVPAPEQKKVPAADASPAPAPSPVIAAPAPSATVAVAATVSSSPAPRVTTGPRPQPAPSQAPRPAPPPKDPLKDWD
jgi:eukaryotic-like serine/threonine-protein kinase